ncbi:MAG TPA: hypothetical protein VHU40_13680, partial [Polyangia bacterium]|nr:hypothetical protein [Polyangia bacterium]
MVTLTPLGLLATAGWLAVGSCDDDRGVISVDVLANQTTFTDVTLRITLNNSNERTFGHVAFDATKAFKAGVYIPDGVSGTVHLTGNVDDGKCLLGTGMVDVQGVMPGASAGPVTLTITRTPAGTCLPIHVDGGSGDATGSGGAGTGSGGTTTGSGGTTTGSGGAGTGTGGVGTGSGGAGTGSGGSG